MATFLELYPHVIWHADPELYDCSNRTMDEWIARGMKRPLQGWFSICFGSLVLLLYILTIIAMTNREFLRNSCYQMMYFASLSDVCNLVFSNIIPGLWNGYCVCVMSLGFSRLAEVTGYGKWMFTGRMVGFWMGLSILVSVFDIFMTKSAMFNSQAGAWAFIPFIHDNIEMEFELYKNVMVPYTNLLTGTAVLLNYLVIFIFLRCKQTTVGEKTFSSLQKKLLIQCTLICSVLALCCFIYGYMLLFTTPAWVILIGQICYQLSECTPLLSYLIFNASVRQKVLLMLRLCGFTKVAPTTHTSSRSGLGNNPRLDSLNKH